MNESIIPFLLCCQLVAVDIKQTYQFKQLGFKEQNPIAEAILPNYSGLYIASMAINTIGFHYFGEKYLVFINLIESIIIIGNTESLLVTGYKPLEWHQTIYIARF